MLETDYYCMICMYLRKNEIMMKRKKTRSVAEWEGREWREKIEESPEFNLLYCQSCQLPACPTSKQPSSQRHLPFPPQPTTCLFLTFPVHTCTQPHPNALFYKPTHKHIFTGLTILNRVKRWMISKCREVHEVCARKRRRTWIWYTWFERSIHSFIRFYP